MPYRYRYTVRDEDGAVVPLYECTNCNNDLTGRIDDFSDPYGENSVNVTYYVKSSPATVDQPARIGTDGWLCFDDEPAIGDFLSIECNCCGTALAGMEGVVEERSEAEYLRPDTPCFWCGNSFDRATGTCLNCAAEKIRETGADDYDDIDPEEDYDDQPPEDDDRRRGVVALTQPEGEQIVLTLPQFCAASRARCESPLGFNHPLTSWSASDWMTAIAGETGEAANLVKKLNRVRDGIPGNTETEEELKTKLRDESADAVIYWCLFAESQGFDLWEAIIAKFNKTSEKIGYPIRL